MDDTETPRTSAERAAAIVEAHQRTSQGLCSGEHRRDQLIDSGVPMWAPEHVVHMLAAAGLLATAEHHPVADQVIHPEQAVGFARWLAEHDRQVIERYLSGEARDA